MESTGAVCTGGAEFVRVVAAAVIFEVLSAVEDSTSGLELLAVDVDVATSKKLD
jgi:hypothetical protein